MNLILVPSERELDHLLPRRPRPEMVGWLPVYRDGGLHWAVCGIGPTAAALATAHLLARYRPQRLILAGIAGAFAGSGLRPGDLVQGDSDIFADLGYRDGNHFVTLDEMNLTMLPTGNGPLPCRFSLQRLIEDMPAYSFITVSAITNSRERADALFETFAAALENMEGAAVAAACHLAAIPFYQVRAVSNMVGPRDPGTWQVAVPLQALAHRLRKALGEEER